MIRQTRTSSILSAWLLCAALLALALLPQEATAATGTCNAATSQGTNGPADYSTYCWIDFTNYNAAQATGAGEAFTVTLPGGSTLSFTLTVSAAGTVGAVAIPTWTGAAFGQSAFIGVPGKPALYQTADGATTNVSLSNIVLTVGSGTVPYAIVAADAESTNGGESLSFTTNGNAWTELAAMAYTGSTIYPTLSGVGTTTVTETGVTGNVGAYAFSTQGSPTTISSVMVGSGLQGIAFGVKFHAVDFAVTSSHTGNFNLGTTDSYTLTVTSNGPDQYTPTDTVIVTDTLPTGMTYVSASGSGWTCSAVGQVVTCTATNVTVNSGSSLPVIILNVSLGYTTATTLTNTATVASNPNLDYNTTNNTATDVTTLVDPDLSTSTKTVVNTSGGDALVGGTLQYTVTLMESAGVQAINASVTDDVPASVSGFTVTSFPTGATNSSTGTGTGTNNTGYLNVTGITVPANGSVTVVFTVQVATGTANCATINNTATITNPYGTGATPVASTVIVAQSSCAASGNKILYLYDGTGPTYTNLLNRVVQTTNTTTATTIDDNSNHVWTMTPAVATGKSLLLTAANVIVSLIVTNTNTATTTARNTTVSLLNNGVVVATSPTVVTNNSATAKLLTYTIAIPTTTVLAGNALGIRVNDTTTTNNHDITVSQKTALGNSEVSFATTTVINVDSVTAYNAVYPAVTTTTVYVPNTTVYICAVISDPFGSADVTSANITLTDPNGTVQVSGAAMTAKGAANCAGTASTATEAFEYTFAIPTTAATGFWTASVTGHEGTEGTVTHTANGPFDVDVPSLLFMKSVSVSSDPVEGATKPKALPGATVQYTILVQNNGRGPADSGTLVLADAVPANTAFDLTAATPFTFTDGSTASGLSAPVMTFSNNGGTSYVYTPTCTRPCTDATITDFKITFTGGMNGKTGASAPSFTILFSVVLQ